MQSGQVMACVSSQDALYYGCAESWDEMKGRLLWGSGVIRIERAHSDHGSACVGIHRQA